MKIKGIAASDGFAIAKAFVITKTNYNIKRVSILNVDEELKRLLAAIDTAKKDISLLMQHTKETIGKEEADIFGAHLLIADDPEIFSRTKAVIESSKVNAEYALQSVSNEFISMFENINTEYMRERAIDVRDVTERIIKILLGIKSIDLSKIESDVIIIADDLTPTETAQLNPKFTKGIITNIGGKTSHSAIIARSLEIPAVLGTKNITKVVKNGDNILIDGTTGEVEINPTNNTIEVFMKKYSQYNKLKKLWSLYKDKKTITKDGHIIELAANISSIQDVDNVLRNGAEGIGLFRTEFIYMESNDFPSENDQFEIYKSILQKMGDKPVVIRTLDIGGDKNLSYWDLPSEMNPFLGQRAIRLCLANVEIFKTQLRALLRASVYGNMKIMFPMIATVGEIKHAMSIYDNVKNELLQEKYSISDSIEIGIMVEIPAAAIHADKLAKYVDFFSIGTNDLIQYTMAADRMNENVSYLYQPLHPVILKLINMVIKAGEQEGCWVGMCGEMASDPIAFPILIGLGLKEFSMTSSSILHLRYNASNIEFKEVRVLAEEALNCEKPSDIIKLVLSITQVEDIL